MSLGYVHANSFSFGFVYGDAENGQRLSVDTAVFMKTKTYAFSFASTFESVFILMRFCRKCSASWCGQKAQTHQSVCGFKRRRISVDRALVRGQQKYES